MTIATTSMSITITIKKIKISIAMDEKRQLQKISDRIDLLRDIALLLQVFALIIASTLCFIPHALSLHLKIWLVAVAGGSFLGILIVLFLARRDSVTTQFFTLLSVFISGIFLGLAVCKLDGLLDQVGT